MGRVATEVPPLLEPECAPFVFLDGCSIEFKNGLLYVVGWQHCNGGDTEERRIVIRGAIPLTVAMSLHKVFLTELTKMRRGGH